MKNFCLNICQVEEILKRRFKISPRAIEPWESSIQFNLDTIVISSNEFVWRYDDRIEGALGLITLDFPFFYGFLNLDVFHLSSDPVNAAAYSVHISDYSIDSITTLYNVTQHVIKSYSDTDDPAPGVGQNETLDKIRFDHPIVSPYLDVVTIADATGKIYLKMKATFSGFRIYMT